MNNFILVFSPLKLIIQHELKCRNIPKIWSDLSFPENLSSLKKIEIFIQSKKACFEIELN